MAGMFSRRLTGGPPNPALADLIGSNEPYDPEPPPIFRDPPPQPPQPGLVIEPANWRDEEQAAKAAELQDELEPEQPKPSYPAKKGAGTSKKTTQASKPTPNLDKVRGWRYGKGSP